MSQQAPQQIRLKRKLQLEQVDSDQAPEVLYLQSTQRAQVFVRVDSSSKRRQIQPRSRAPSSKNNGHTFVTSIQNEVRETNQTSNNLTTPSQSILNPSESPSKQSSALQKYVLSTGKKRRGSIATFERQGDRPSKRVHLSDDEDVEKPSSTEPQTPPRRKRPGASEAEKKWRAQNWRPKPELLANGHTNENDTVLIKDTVFQSMLEELDEAEVAAMAHSAATGPKFKPRANVVRLKDRGATPDLDHTNDSMVVDSADEHDYVYDTYILQEAMDIDLSTADPSNVGILVIAEEHKAIWETYLDEPESDEEQRSDDEDSNAEDHYGADYPEDELDFEDEHDIDAYRYRRNASDDEQYGYGSDDDYAAHSDDEGADADFHPFRRH